MRVEDLRGEKDAFNDGDPKPGPAREEAAHRSGGVELTRLGEEAGRSGLARGGAEAAARAGVLNHPGLKEEVAERLEKAPGIGSGW